MTLDEIVRELRRISYSPTIREISRRGAISHTEVYRVIRSGRASNRIKAALERALQGGTNDRYHNRASPPVSGPPGPHR